MKPRNVKLLLPLIAALVSGPVAAEWDFAGNVDLAARVFTEDARWPGQDDSTLQLSIAGSAEARWRGDDARASIIPYLRYDATDDERSLTDLREAYWAHEAESHELLLGFNTVFWGVTESVHLVDVINQTDAVADIDGETKLGQPMVNLELQRDWGLVGAYLIPIAVPLDKTEAALEVVEQTPSRTTVTIWDDRAIRLIEVG